MKKLLVRIALVVMSVVLLIQLIVFAALMVWRTQPVERSMFMHRYVWSGQQPELKHQWVDGNQISVHLKRALIAGEDAKFVQHHGFDWDGIQAALKRNESRGEVVAGGSTISQQLAKNLFLWNERSYIRKAQEAVITVMIERLWSKDRILTVYLNSIEFGQGIYGAEAAARHYYGRSAKNLSRQQAARLASLVPNPVYYQANPNHRRVKHRERVILRYMNASQLP
ncbi:MAG: monofunctional biosynthetic peptidoglycan transglycosylase [Pseudomonadota bacterium]|nr:monofunctional biosynthetic peptidoglycan transglycosylase [Pseudomonadota bacterium]